MTPITPSSAYAFLNPDVFLFFDQHIDALPMYARLEQAIRARIPDVRLKVTCKLEQCSHPV